MTLIVNIHEAKTHLSKLLARVSVGEEIIIAKAGRPVARLAPLEKTPARRVAGSAVGEVALKPDFDAPLPDDVIEAFEQ